MAKKKPLIYHNRTGGCPSSRDGKHSWKPIMVTIPARDLWSRPETRQGAECLHCRTQRSSKP